MDDYGLIVEIRDEPGHVLITVAGEVDIATVPHLQERLAAAAASGRPLIVDLDLVTCRQIAAALALGAAGVWMGSAWLATQEYATTTSAPSVTNAVLKATSSDTVRSPIFSGKPARLLKNRWTDAWEQPGAPEPLGMPLQNLLVSEAHQRLIRSGRPDLVPMQAGQIVGRITEVRPVAAVMANLVKETRQTLEKLQSLR